MSKPMDELREKKLRKEVSDLIVDTALRIKSTAPSKPVLSASVSILNGERILEKHHEGLDAIMSLFADYASDIERRAREDEATKARQVALVHSMDTGEAIYAVLDKRVEQLRTKKLGR